jgi:dihydrofolate synthase / folylpolyglutamate synthase
MDCQAAFRYFESLIDYERTVTEARNARFFNLARMEQLLAKLGNPEQGRNFLHVAGTKGKGSTAAMAAAIAQAAGYRVGLYTSPHLISFRERIRISGAIISEEEVGELAETLVAPIESLRGSEAGTPSFFEAYTALALLYFRRGKVDLAVMETGLGGRLDATNVISPLCCGITTIAFDHAVELGDTLAAIAGEKAGIIKSGVPVVCAPQQSEARAVIAKVCREKGAPLFEVGDWEGESDIQVRSRGPVKEGQGIDLQGLKGSYHAVCALRGEHQAGNAGVAVGMAELLGERGFAIGSEAILRGLAQVRWPGRLQIVPGEPPIVLDGAHDVASAKALRRSLSQLFPQGKMIFVLGVSQDKDLEGIVEELLPAAEAVIVTAANSPRSASLEALAEVCRRHFPDLICRTAKDTESALAQAREGREGKVVVVTGSLYLVGEAMAALGITPQ